MFALAASAAVYSSRLARDSADSMEHNRKKTGTQVEAKGSKWNFQLLPH